MDQVRKLKEPPGRVRFLSDDERERLLAACKQSTNKELYLAFILALSTGARQGEIMRLRWGADVDLARSTIIIQVHDGEGRHSKNGERRAVPLIGPARNLLIERGKVRRIDTDLIFPGKTYPPKPIDLRRPWLIALKASGVEDPLARFAA